MQFIAQDFIKYQLTGIIIPILVKKSHSKVLRNITSLKMCDDTFVHEKIPLKSPSVLQEQGIVEMFLPSFFSVLG